MRNPDRIDKFCNELAECWKKVPDWRFGQLICNVLNSCQTDPFFWEDNKMITYFKEYFDDSKQS